MSEYILEMKNISKSFSGVKALDNVMLQVKPGEVHALMGENGAGKSTLMKILMGIYSMDGGEIIMDGGKYKANNPKEAMNAGISMIHQELNPILDMPVYENIFVGKLKVAMCMSHQTNDFQITVTSAAVAKGKELGIEVVVFDGNNDSATQISQIESAVDQGYDGIIFEPINVDAVQNIVDYATQEGVPVINAVGAMTDWEDYVAGYVGGDNVTAGEMEMRKVAELLDGKGNIAILNGPMGSDPQIQRHEGYDIVLAEYPDLVVMNEDDAEWATDKALNIVENWLQSGKDINAVVCQNDGMAVGAAKAIQDAGLTDVIVTGIDATSDGIDAIKSGAVTGTVSQDAAGQGSLSVETMYKVIKGETLADNDLRTENIWINSSNANDY